MLKIILISIVEITLAFILLNGVAQSVHAGVFSQIDTYGPQWVQPDLPKGTYIFNQCVRSISRDTLETWAWWTPDGKTKLVIRQRICHRT